MHLIVSVRCPRIHIAAGVFEINADIVQSHGVTEVQVLFRAACGKVVVISQ